MKSIIRKMINIVLILSLLTTGVFIGMNFDGVSYAAENMGDLTNKGQSLTKTATDGSEFTFTSKTASLYTVQLYGPAGAGANAGKGGYVQAVVSLKANDTLNIYLGSQAEAPSGARNGAKGVDGSGYGDSGTHKAKVSLYSMELMTAGGGGAAANPGVGTGFMPTTLTDYATNYAGTGNQVTSWHTESGHATQQWCSVCGKSVQGGCEPAIDATHRCYLYYTVGGTAGVGSNAGALSVTAGGSGAPGAVAPSTLIDMGTNYNFSSYVCGSHASWARCRTGVQVSMNTFYRWTQGGTGGIGGAGGASYIDEGNVVSSSMELGKNDGVARVIITMGDKVVAPEGESMERVAAATEKMADAIAGTTNTPVMTVVAGKAFSFYTSGPTMTIGGSSNNITIINNDLSDKYVQVSGRLDNPGMAEAVIDGYKYVFNVIEEPNSGNVTAVFN